MYMIHTCQDRLWYVNRFLIPSMLSQGISKSEIMTYNDENGDGNLKSCSKSFKLVSLNSDGDTWHLQDDVVISHDFKERTERFDNHVPNFILSGMCMDIDEDASRPTGVVSVENLWYSFQCIRIPNKIAGEFSDWVEHDAMMNPDYRLWIRRNKYDDSLFKEFLIDKHNDIGAVNIYPNLVDHVDYIIGGSLVNKDFDADRRAKYFTDQYLVKDLEKSLNSRNISIKLKEQIERLNHGSKRHTDFSRFNGHTHRFTEPDNYNGAE